MARTRTSWQPGHCGNPHGRQKITVPETHFELITELAAKGCREVDIARACGMAQVTWTRRKSEDPRIVEAIEAGRGKMHDALVGRLHQKAMDGDTIALLFLLKTRFQYREGEEPGSGSRPTVIINLPGATPMEKFVPAATALIDYANGEPSR